MTSASFMPCQFLAADKITANAFLLTILTLKTLPSQFQIFKFGFISLSYHKPCFHEIWLSCF